jgi:TadE-like protein
MATLIRFRRCDRGQAVIELALTLPLLLLVLCGVLDFGFMFQRYEVVTNAAREAARVGVLPAYTPTDAVNRGRAYMDTGGLAVPNRACGVMPEQPRTRCVEAFDENSTIGTGPTAKTVQQIRVVVEYDHEHVFVGPMMGLFGSSLGITRLHAVSIMRREAD